MKKVEIKVGLLSPNTTYTRSNGTEWLMLSDSDGSTKSKHTGHDNKGTGKISYPFFNETVLVDEQSV